MSENLTFEEAGADQEVVPQLRSWLQEGCDIAVYENVYLSPNNPDLGKKTFLKVGKGCTFKEAPKRLPDNPTTGISWRYWLKGVIRNDCD